MREFFRCWRRKVGVLTLLMALLFVAAWVRSCSILDVINISVGGYGASFVSGSQNCRLFVEGELPLEVIFKGKLQGQPFFEIWAIAIDDADSWKFFHKSAEGQLGKIRSHRPDQQIRPDIQLLPYWSIAVPLTAIAAFLLLSKPRKSTTQKIVDPIPETAV